MFQPSVKDFGLNIWFPKGIGPLQHTSGETSVKAKKAILHLFNHLFEINMLFFH